MTSQGTPVPPRKTRTIEHIVRYAVIVRPGNIMEPTVVMDVKDSSGEVSGKTTNISADFHGIASSTRTNEISVGIVGYESASEPE